MTQSLRNGAVSVILAAYNAENYIASAIRSVLSQTYSHLELIVVDDGSTDDTVRIVSSFARRDARVKLIRQSNLGVGSARNVGIRRARGRFVAPIDADDIWHPTKVEKQIACFERRGDRTGMVYCWSRRLDAEGRVVGLLPAHRIEGTAFPTILLRNFVGNASTPMFRATALACTGLYLTRSEQGGVQGFEDWDLSVRLTEQFEVGLVPEYLVDYRVHERGMSTDTSGMAASFEVVVSRAQRRNPQIRRRMFRWSRGHFYYYIARKSSTWGRFTLCLRCIIRAVAYDPVHLLNPSTYRIFAVALHRRGKELARSSCKRPARTNGNEARVRDSDEMAAVPRPRPPDPWVRTRRVTASELHGALTRLHPLAHTS